MTLTAVHAAASWLSYAAFLCAGCAGAGFLLQERQLKRKHHGAIMRSLPSLVMLERVTLGALTAGLVLLGAGIASGMAGTKGRFGEWWLGDPKEVLTIGVWVGYLMVVAGRVLVSMRGRRIAVWSVLGLGGVLVAALGAAWWASVHPYG
ncbi:MAG TPA: cytochrome c biogenesis protein CcsA [bacterium]